MGESDRYIDYKLKKKRFTLGQPDNALMWLFAINVIFFLILLTIKVAINVNDHSSTAFYTQVVYWFQLPADLVSLSKKPWTIISYMFSDVDVMRALSNMLWLSAFGSVLQNLTGNKKIIPVYLYGGFAGAVFFIAAVYLIPTNRAVIDSLGLLGANASVMAVAIAATMIAPSYRFFRDIRGGIPIWILTVIYVAIDLASIARGPAAFPIAHMGGAFAGYLFVKMLKHNMDGSEWMNKFYNWFINLFNPNKKKQTNSVKERVFYNIGSKSPYSKTSIVTEQRVDEILDKINQKGYDHLTKEEKDILKRASED
ncbi:MAG: rhomboid family intramembrane serine protease [Chitinophagaceae bacterium]|nr:rhomboid family intramembrane serine protease [Chitinophagaceae bacterium]